MTRLQYIIVSICLLALIGSAFLGYIPNADEGIYSYIKQQYVISALLLFLCFIILGHYKSTTKPLLTGNNKTWIECAWDRIIGVLMNHRWLLLVLLWGIALISAFSPRLAESTPDTTIQHLVIAALILLPFFPLGLPGIFCSDFDETPLSFVWLWIIFIWICFAYMRATDRGAIFTYLAILAILLAITVGGCITTPMPMIFRSGRL